MTPKQITEITKPKVARKPLELCITSTKTFQISRTALKLQNSKRKMQGDHSRVLTLTKMGDRAKL